MLDVHRPALKLDNAPVISWPIILDRLMLAPACMHGVTVWQLLDLIVLACLGRQATRDVVIDAVCVGRRLFARRDLSPVSAREQDVGEQQREWDSEPDSKPDSHAVCRGLGGALGQSCRC